MQQLGSLLQERGQVAESQEMLVRVIVVYRASAQAGSAEGKLSLATCLNSLGITLQVREGGGEVG